MTSWVDQFQTIKFIFREYSLTLKRIFVIFREWKYVSMYALTCTLLLTYPTQTPLLFSGSRLDRQWFLRFICAQRKNDRIYARIYMPHPTPFRYRFTVHFLTYPFIAGYIKVFKILFRLRLPLASWVG